MDPLFEFEPFDKRISWKDVLVSDVHRIFIEGNVDELKRLVPSVVRGNLSKEKNLQRDPAIDQAFQLTQLSSQYLRHCTTLLEERCVYYKSQKKILANKLKTNDKTSSRQMETLQRLRFESQKLSDLLTQYEKLETCSPGSNKEKTTQTIPVVEEKPKSSAVVESPAVAQQSTGTSTASSAVLKIQTFWKKKREKSIAADRIYRFIVSKCHQDSEIQDLYEKINRTLARAAQEVIDLKTLFDQFADSKGEFINRMTLRIGLKCLGIETTRRQVRKLLDFLRTTKLDRDQVSRMLQLSYQEFLLVFNYSSE